VRECEEEKVLREERRERKRTLDAVSVVLAFYALH